MQNALVLLATLIVSLTLLAEEKQSKLAVMEIEDRSGKLSKALLENAAEALRAELVASNKFIVISKDRQRNAMIKGEKKEKRKECYDQQCRIALGQALTADMILTGIVTYSGKRCTLAVEMIDLAKKATVKGANADFDGTEDGLADAINSVVGQLVGVQKTGGGSAFDNFVAEGNKAIGEQRFSDAIHYYKAALKEDPNAGRVYKSLGLAYSLIGNAAQACQNYRKYIMLVPAAPDKAQVEDLLSSCK